MDQRDKSCRMDEDTLCEVVNMFGHKSVEVDRVGTWDQPLSRTSRYTSTGSFHVAGCTQGSARRGELKNPHPLVVAPYSGRLLPRSQTIS